MGKWLTPDSIPSPTVCRAVFIPDSVDWLAIVAGALIELTYPKNWEQSGLLTPADCTQSMRNMLDQYTFNLPQLISTNPNVYRITET